MKYCISCGFRLEDDASFCRNCGAKQAEVNKIEDIKPDSTVSTVPETSVEPGDNFSAPVSESADSPAVAPVYQTAYAQNQTAYTPAPQQYTQYQPPVNPAPTYYQAPANSMNYQPEVVPSNSVGVAGFVCGLLSLFFCWVPLIGIILPIIGLVCSGKGISKGRPYGRAGLSIAGLVLSILGVISGAIYTIVWIAFIVATASYGTAASSLNLWLSM